jgi:hypothetical protein
MKLSVADAAPVSHPQPPESGVVPRGVPAHAGGVRPMGRRRLAVLRSENNALDLVDPVDETFPRTRGDCLDGPRPCPWVRCRHHLLLDVTRTGGLVMNFPGAELEDLPDTCALDVAARGGHTLEETGQRVNVTRERVRQLEVVGLSKIRRAVEAHAGLREHCADITRNQELRRDDDFARFADEDLDDP